jgi:integrase
LRVKKEPSEITRKDIEDYLYSIRELSQYTLGLKKTVIKNLFQWFYQCEKREYPKIVSWMDTSLKVDPMLFRGKQDLLTTKEMEKLLDSCDNLRDRSMIMTTLEWGLRASSLKNLSIKDVKEDNGYLSIFIRGKGKVSGELTLFDSSNDLRAWLKCHKFKDKPDAPLFYTLRRFVGSRLTTSDIYAMIRRTSKKARLQKKVYTHLLRHQALTRKGKFYTDQELKVIALWKSSAMTKRYIHLDSEDIKRKEMIRRGILPPDIGEDETLKKCQTPLDMKSVMEKERERENFFKEYDDVMPKIRTLLNDPDIKKIIEERKSRGS